MTALGNCTSGCPEPGTHATWGECLKAKNTRVGWARSLVNIDLTAEKKHQDRIQLARKARKEGIRPDSTSLRDVQRAIDISDKTGKPYISERP